MKVIFYSVTDDPRVVDKTLGTAVKTITGVKTKADCSILTPTLELAYDSLITGCNYMYIEDWGRYYYIDELTLSAQRLFVRAHVDVLKTYAAAIKSCTAILRRQARYGAGSKTNLYLNDKAFVAKAYSNPHVRLFRSVTDDSVAQFTKTDMSFVLALAGAGT